MLITVSCRKRQFSYVLIPHIYEVSDTCFENDSGYGCKSNFEYDGKTHNSCTKAGGYYTAWCYDSRGYDNWDYCSDCDPGIWVLTGYRLIIPKLIICNDAIYISNG